MHSSEKVTGTGAPTPALLRARPGNTARRVTLYTTTTGRSARQVSTSHHCVDGNGSILDPNETSKRKHSIEGSGIRGPKIGSVPSKQKMKAPPRTTIPTSGSVCAAYQEKRIERKLERYCRRKAKELFVAQGKGPKVEDGVSIL